MILDDIIEKTKLDLINKKTKISSETLEQQIKKKTFIIKNVIQALKSSQEDKYKIIAEVKKS